MKKNYGERTLNKKKITYLIIVILIILFVIVMGILYDNNSNLRDFMDKYIFLKEKYENNLPQIAISSSNDINVYAYKENILVLKNNLLTAYNSNGKEEYTLEIEISNPIFETAGNYLCIGEKNGEKLYVISDKNIVWQKDLEGNILDIALNTNGYVAVATTGTIHKTIVQTFDNNGKEQFYVYLSSTYVIDMSVSQDSKYLAIAETNFSGILIQSNIKIISIEDAKNENSDFINYTQTNKNGDLISKIKYQTKDELTCVYDNHIEVIKDKNSTNISDLQQDETLFVDLNNKIIKIIKKDSHVYLQIIDNSKTDDIKEYEINEPKEIYTSSNAIAVNLGSEVLFFNNSGWLIKKYYATQEISKIVLSDDLAGIIYNDKIELVSL